jgi:rhodanese-related sulfurtransferase
MTAGGYKADIGPDEVWTRLGGDSIGDDSVGNDSGGVLIDVRSRAEWAFVGAPDLSPIGKQVVFAAWQDFPAMQIDADFASALDTVLAGEGVKRDADLFFLCRSGGRSAAAAAAMTGAGYGSCFNVAGGFEGGHDENGQRGKTAGWKAAGLPWRQP